MENKFYVSETHAGIKNSQSQFNCEQDVIDVYLSNDSSINLSKKYNISIGAIRGIKRGEYYVKITKNLGSPGLCISKNGCKRRILTHIEIQEIFISSLTIQEYFEKFNIKTNSIKVIKERKKYKKLTKELGEPGKIIYQASYKLSNDDIKEIQKYDLTEQQLSKKYNISTGTIQYWRSKRKRNLNWKNLDQMTFKKID